MKINSNYKFAYLHAYKNKMYSGTTVNTSLTAK